MRLYKVVVDVDAAKDDEPRVAWAGTQAEARSAKKGLAERNGLGPLSKHVAIQETDIPTNKEGLLKFLQDNIKE
jgi:hypothetical protein